MPGAGAASPAGWDTRHVPTAYCNTNAPEPWTFCGLLPGREDFTEGRRAGGCEDIVLSSFCVSSLLLGAAAEHFPAEREAMRLMSPICDSLSHPLPGGQRCLCLRGLTAVSEGWRLGSQVPFPALSLGARRTEDPSKHPALGGDAGGGCGGSRSLRDGIFSN